jgi:uncharacterized membrane protein
MSEHTEFSDVAKWGAVIVGMVMAVPILAILATQAQAALLTLVVVGFLAWAGVRSGVLAKDEEGDQTTTDADPLATLQERYAAGELSEAEFEARLDKLLESDQRAEDADDLESAALERDAVFERE